MSKKTSKVVFLEVDKDMKDDLGRFICVLCDIFPPVNFSRAGELLNHVNAYHMKNQGKGKFGHPEVYIPLVFYCKQIYNFESLQKPKKVKKKKKLIKQFFQSSINPVQMNQIKVNPLQKLERTTLVSFSSKQIILDKLGKQGLTYSSNFMSYKMEDYPLVEKMYNVVVDILKSLITVCACVDNNDFECKMTFGVNRNKEHQLYHPLLNVLYL